MGVKPIDLKNIVTEAGVKHEPVLRAHKRQLLGLSGMGREAAIKRRLFPGREQKAVLTQACTNKQTENSSRRCLRRGDSG